MVLHSAPFLGFVDLNELTPDPLFVVYNNVCKLYAIFSLGKQGPLKKLVFLTFRRGSKCSLGNEWHERRAR